MYETPSRGAPLAATAVSSVGFAVAAGLGLAATRGYTAARGYAAGIGTAAGAAAAAGAGATGGGGTSTSTASTAKDSPGEGAAGWAKPIEAAPAISAAASTS